MKNLLPFLLIVQMILPAAASAAPDALIIQAEEFTDYNELGFRQIYANPVGFLEGLDSTGEWTEYDADFFASGTWSAAIYLQGAAGIPYHLQLILTPAGGGDSQVVNFEFVGAGCG